MPNDHSPSDQALANWASNGAAHREFTALEFGFLIRDLGPMCRELIAMRAADPLEGGETEPDRATDAELQNWAMCFEANPEYLLTKEDLIALPPLMSCIAGELLGFRLLISKEKSKKGTRLRQCLARRAHRLGLHTAIAAE